MNSRSSLPRWTFTVLGILSLVFLSIGVSSPVGAQEAAATTQEAAKQSTADADLPPLPLSPIEKAQKDGTALPLSLKDVTKLALQNNLDIAIQDTNEQLSQQKITEAYGAYDPSLSASLGVDSSKIPNTNYATASAGSPFSSSDGAKWNFTFTQPVRKTGGTLTATWNADRSDSTSSFNLFNPRYGASTTIEFRQPLWRNLRIDQNRAQIKLYNLELATSNSQFKAKVTDTIASIQSQYWDLVAAIRDYDIKRKSVELGQITLRDNKKKVEVGTLAPIGVTEAQADLANRELNLITSEENILRQENALRALISNNRNSEIWSQVIIPTDTPDFREYKVELGTAIDTALMNRPELEQADISLKQQDINLQLAKNSRKWQWDLTARYGSTGSAGPQAYKPRTVVVNGEPTTVFDGNGNIVFDPTTPEALVGGIGNAYKTIFTEGFTNWSIAFSVQIPLGNRANDARYAQQMITKQKQLMDRKNREQSIQVEIRNAIQRLDTSRKQVETSKMGRQLAEEQLDGEQKRFQAGLSENFRVLERQNQLAERQNQELTNLINYRKSIIQLQKAMYTLLESNDFEVAKGSSSNVPDLK